MHHAPVVRVLQGVADLEGDVDGLIPGYLLPLGDLGAERSPGHVLHGVPGQAILLPGVDELDDVRMVERAEGPHLPAEPLAKPRAAAELRRQDLDGDLRPGLLVEGLVDGPHPALTQLAVDEIGSEARRTLV